MIDVSGGRHNLVVMYYDTIQILFALDKLKDGHRLKSRVQRFPGYISFSSRLGYILLLVVSETTKTLTFGVSAIY